ncbi:MAG: cyclic beta 1-2 glucan synthetase, partial [Porticoccaceae bacterium]
MNAGTWLTEFLRRLTAGLRGRGSPRTTASGEPPLRAELFSADQMAQHGKTLAAAHRVAPGHASDRLLDRLAANEHALVEVCRLLTAAVAQGRQITPAGEWLLDNFYLIEEQIRTAKRHLPEGYSRELPRLAQGSSARHPRVYDIALETIAHGDARVDVHTLGRFVAAYQTVTPLNLGELWAVPIMLRLAVIENLRRIGVGIGADWAERDLADVWADRMTQAAEQDPKSLILVVADMARSDPPMVSTFVAELARRLQGQGPALSLPLTWIEQRLAEAGLTIAQLVQSENQQQAADQVSISNSIGSLRVLGALEWREFVETLSVVEQTLREDPGGVYGGMDFATRDRYRHTIEKIAKKTGLAEAEVARQAIELARKAAIDIGAGTDAPAAHVGYYLIDQGLAELERTVQVRGSPLAALRSAVGRWPLPLYLGGIALLTAVITVVLLTGIPAAEMPGWSWAPIGILALLAVSQLAGALVNWLASLLVTPHPLPRMDFSKGIPPQARTLVVVPTLLTSASGVEDLIEALEVRFLANRDEHLHFGLLTDFADADQQALPADGSLLQLAELRIAALNQKYAPDSEQTSNDRFFLFHRPRRWNPQERRWMGCERKRGKLADLNALLRGASWGNAEDGFGVVVGDTTVLRDARYVITLDTDTQLPRDAAR